MIIRHFLILLILFLYPLCLFSENPNGFKESRGKFDQKIRILSDHPEKLEFAPLQDFSMKKDSAGLYLTWLKSIYTADMAKLNRNQKIAFLYEIGQVYFFLNQGDSTIAYMDKVIGMIDKNKNPLAYILSKTNEEELIKMRTAFDHDLQKEKIVELQLRQNLLFEKSRRNTTLIITISCILLLGMVFLYLLFNQNLKLKQSYVAIVRKNIELDKISEKIRGIRETVNNENGGSEIMNGKDLAESLRMLFEKEKLYKSHDISLSILAEMLGTNKSYLSAVINHHFGMNFKSLIHKYRIDEARLILVSDDYMNFSMEGVAHELGYKSRSLFHQMFKEITGVTPAVYSKTFHDAVSENGSGEKEEV